MTDFRALRVFLFAVFACLVAPFALAQVSLTTLGVPYTQNFDTLPASGSATWTNNSTIPGWFHARTGTGATVVANNGSSNAGNLYSYGTGTDTDRALGSVGSGNAAVGNLFWGVRLQNNTGATITQLDVAYRGEQWRNSAAAAHTAAFSYLVGSPTVTGSLAEFQSAGTTVTNLDFTSPSTAMPAGFINGNNGANNTPTAFSITGLSIPNGAEVMLRWSDPDHAGADHGLSIDDFSVTPQNGPAVPVLNISDVTLAEGNPPGTTSFTFAVTLTAPAGAGGVTFDIATADGTAQDDNPGGEDEDYVAHSLTGQSIPMGSTGPYNFNVTVNRDTDTESNETFFVNVTSITGANAGDAQGLGTISNDDVTLVPVHDIQGPGANSPIVGASVTTSGIVTGVKNNGFYIQEPDASVDADPATSEGIFVFTSSAPPAAATIGNLVQVTATVVEFVPTADPLQPPLTELSSPTVVQLSTGNPLPAAIPLTATFPDPAGPHDQLERLEGMRVSVGSLTVTAPTEGNVNEANATATSNGVFHGVVTGVARPFRGPGIQAPDPAPSGSVPPIPRWDANPELLRVDSDAQTGATRLDVSSEAFVTGLVGPLDYTFRRYTILPDPVPAPVVVGGKTPTSVPSMTTREFTVASYNLERFFDTVNDPGVGEPVLTATAYDTRLSKASLAIRNHLGTPDILGVIEVEKLATLQDLATRINNDAMSASQPDPQYVPFLDEGNDVGGIDVGFLVKTAPVVGATPRVTVNQVVQELDATLFLNPDSSTEILNDRPPLRLDALVNHPNGAAFPLQVIVVHQRSLNGVEDLSPGSSGWATAGERVRAKRQAQANDLSNLIQTRQTSDPTERIIILGDFNAFEFNDGFVDAMNVVTGTPSPDNETAVAGDGIDLVNPDLDNLVDTPPAAERYSFVFEGNAQNLDHMLVNQALIAATTARRIEHPRINTDFPELDRNDASIARRLSDHDPVAGFFEVAAFTLADMSVTKTDNVDPVNAGQNFFYTITVANNGPDAADSVSWSDALPADTTFVSLSQPGGWTCTTPAVGANGTVTCSIASLNVGSAVFNVTVAVNAGLASGSVLSNTATATSSTSEPNPGNESDTAATTVNTSADLLLSKTDSPDPVTAGNNLSYQLTLTNNGPSNAVDAAFSDTLPAGATFVSLSTTGSWTCTTPAVGASGTISCSNTSFPVTVDFFTIVVNVDPAVAAGTVLSNTAALSSTTSDPNGANNSDTATTTVATSADLQVTKTDSPDPVTAGNNLAYTITVTNAGSSDAASVSLTDTVPANTTFVSLAQPAGWPCTTPAVGGTGAIDCSIATFPASGVAAFTLIVNVDASVASGTILSNTATASSTTTDPSPGNESATVTTTVGTGSADLLLSKTASPDPVTAGENVSYQVTLTNNGPSSAADATFSDTLPAGTTFVSLATTGSWTCTTPAVGATGTISCSNASFLATVDFFTIVVNVDPDVAAGTVLSNAATISSSTADPNGANNSDTASTTVTTLADLQLTKSDTPDPVTAGSSLTYTITLANAGPSAATSVSLTDEIPAGTTFVSLAQPAGWTCTTPAIGGTGTVSCSTPTLGVTSAVFTLIVNVDPARLTDISNTATVTSATTDSNPGNESATTTTAVDTIADLEVTKTDTPDPISAGATLTYTITVSNAGPSAAADANLADTVPAGTTFVSLTAPAGWSCTTPAVGGTGAVDCSIATFPAGASEVFTLLVDTDPSLANGTVLSNTATVTATTTDPASGNNSATTTTTVNPVTAFTAMKSVSGSFVSGTTVTYTVVLTNNLGHDQADNAGNEFSDVLPAELELIEATATSGTANAVLASNLVTWNGSIASGSSVTITITATITAPGGTISNQGSAMIDTDDSGDNETEVLTDDPSTGAAGDPTIVAVIPTGAFTGTKSVSGTFTPGAAITYTIVLTNDMGITQPDNAGDELTDVLPASLILVSASATSGTAVVNSGTNTVTWNGSLASSQSVTITIEATIRPDAAPGTTISNQGTFQYDADGNGTNESSSQTDSAGGGSSDATTFVVAAAAAPIAAIPTLDELALLALAAMLAIVAMLVMKR